MQIKPLLRFWPAIIGGWIFSILAVIGIESSDRGFLVSIVQACMASAFFVFLSIAVTLTVERMKDVKSSTKIISQIFVLVAAVLFFFFAHPIFRADLLVGLSFLSIFFLPFIFEKPTNEEFWSWLFKTGRRFLFSFVTTGLFFVSIAVLAVSIKLLFDLNVNSVIIPEIFFCVLGFVSLPVFLFGIPNVAELKDEITTLMSRPIALFIKCVVLPAVCVYFLLVYVYGTKILWTHEWPQGIVGTLTLVFLLFGWKANLLSFPLWSTAKRSTFFFWFGRLFWAGAIPVVILLLVSIGIRIHGFGFTPMRMLVLLTGSWFLGSAIVHLVRRTLSFVLMPSILLLALFFFVLSPWSK